MFPVQKQKSLILEEELQNLQKNHETAAESALGNFLSNWPYASTEEESKAFVDKKLENEYEKRV